MSDSPVKKIDFEAPAKENIQPNASVVDDLDMKTPLVEVLKKEEVKPAVAPTIKPEEADEPLLQENPHRFVLFPIKYHEVCCSRRVTRKVVPGSLG